MGPGDRQYFQNRAEEERAAAKVAAHPRAEQAHLELAERYERLALATEQTASGAPVQLSVVGGNDLESHI